MIIRDYTPEDEKEWLKCRLLSFYHSSYYDDIIHEKPKYSNEMIDLIAVKDGDIIGFLEIEYEQDPKDVCYLEGDRGGVIWNLGVLPDYQGKLVATKLFQEAIHRCKILGLKRLEAWTQDDTPSNRWYEKNRFILKESYLNVYANWCECKKNNMIQNVGEIYGIRSLNFEAPIHRKDELKEKFLKVLEVKLYELNL
ncbi:MAG: GNAT family N-acetyltransferase [Candidatus Delongbacteria bacterium]|nr:GNAT family N-acetyltransferase [Candidatus Delongbacteria bacterium]MBN2833950.1 GNAT family N-acetyltransferase [Candidatus Delongbacteria bacterium]